MNGVRYEEANQIINRFCIDNNAIAVLVGDEESITFGSIESKGDEKGRESVTSKITLANKQSYVLSVASRSIIVDELALSFEKVFPFIIMIILSLFLLSSILANLILVKSIKKISLVSKRMVNLDVTWSCETNREDEIGILENSLDIMAERLSSALKELESANKQLLQKVNIIFQLFYEVALIAIIAFACSFLISNVMVDGIASYFVERFSSSTDALDVMISMSYLLSVYITGMFIIGVSILITSWPIIRLKPKEILTKIN